MNNLEDLETIENYLNGQLPADERARFETALRTDPAVADALAFYVLTKEAARRQAREQRIAELEALRRKPAVQPVMEMAHQGRSRPASGAPTRSLSIPMSFPMQWAAAASVVLLLGIGWLFFQNRNGSLNSMQMADAYITKNYGQLSTQMGGPTDQFKRGVELYNDGQFAAADPVFAQLLAEQPDNGQFLKYAGLVAYRRGQYDQAVERFSRLNTLPDLLDTSGPFLEALARIKRNQPMDKEQAKNLLERVIRENLEGKEEAEELIKVLD